MVNFNNQHYIDKYKIDERIHNIINKHIKKLKFNANLYIIERLLSNNKVVFTEIFGEEHSVYSRIKKLLNDKKELIPEYYLLIKKEIENKIMKIEEGFEETVEEEDKIEKTFLIDERHNKMEMFKLFCDYRGQISFHYNFDKIKIYPCIPQTNNNLQFVKIQITSLPYPFALFIINGYSCADRYNTDAEEKCDSSEIILRKYYEVEGSKEKIDCPGHKYKTDDEGRMKIRKCGKILYPVEKLSIPVQCYYYDVNFEDEHNNSVSAPAFSYCKFTPGYYEAVIYCHTGNFKTPYYQIVDIRQIIPVKFVPPEKIEGENYLFTLQKALDNFHSKQTNNYIYGLIPIKICMLLQKLANILDYRLQFNIGMIGDRSVGKGWLLRRWGFLLYGHLHMSTNGLSVSIPALRGTKDKISILGKDVEINRVGYLGTFKSIQIDEAGENETLTQNLKTFLMESNYSNNMARADGITRKRTAHINLSQNPNLEHIGQYRGSIKKLYENMNVVQNYEKEKWQDNWDLFQPLDSYNNVYLQNCIKRIRDKLEQEKKWWMDGMDIALHDRFPFYFFIVDDNNEELKKVIRENKTKHIIDDNVELIKVLKNDGLEEFFQSLKNNNCEIDTTVFEKVDNIINEFNIVMNSRQLSIFYDIIKLSIIINKRTKANEEDYNLLRYILSKINRVTTLTQLSDNNITTYKKNEIKNVDMKDKQFGINNDNEVDNDFK